MKTLDHILNNYESKALDGRDIARLCKFLSVDQLTRLGYSVVEGAVHTPLAFTRENVIEQLKGDVAFGFEKALNQRGISAGLMYSVVSMWNWVLEEGLEDFSDYAQYGLPLFKATAIKYGFPDEIAGDRGDERKYACE